jgi:hypothetical protein
VWLAEGARRGAVRDLDSAAREVEP